MGKRDFYRRGDWNTICYVCGFKRKASEMLRRWDGVYVCRQDWEIRQPQDFVRGVPDQQALPWTQPEPPDTFTGVATLILLDSAGNAITDSHGIDILTTN